VEDGAVLQLQNTVTRTYV